MKKVIKNKKISTPPHLKFLNTPLLQGNICLFIIDVNSNILDIVTLTVERIHLRIALYT